MLAFGFGVLRWTPDVLWAATPREIAAAASAFTQAKPEAPGQAEMAELMALFPDNQM